MLNVSYDSRHYKAKIENATVKLSPVMTELGICYTFNSKLADVLSPKTRKVRPDILLHSINYFDLETEVLIEEMPTNFDVSV